MSRNTLSTSTHTLEQYSESTLLAAVFDLAHQLGNAVALWMLPNTQEKHVIVDTSGHLVPGKVDLEESVPGFICAPFDNHQGRHNRLIKADLHLVFHQEKLTVEAHDQDFLTQLKSKLDQGNASAKFYLQQPSAKQVMEQQYQQVVTNAVHAINNGAFLKVVPAVNRQLKLPSDFDPLRVFERLCQSYPLAFKSLVSTPDIGTWLGASPEPIIEVDRDKIFSTAALAGTQAYHKEMPLKEVAWRQKEIEEQALVSRYIINCFKKIRLREFEELGPKTVIAGNILHLKTIFEVDTIATNFPQLGTVMLDLLHPTSAICGMPMQQAFDFLKEQEQFDRGYFSGYLGPVNVQQETHIFVNLRCMQLHPDSATLYAGAGVTEDSNPQKEWMETQLKFDTLLSVLPKPA